MAGSFSPNKRSVDVSNLPDQELSYFFIAKGKDFSLHKSVCSHNPDKQIGFQP